MAEKRRCSVRIASHSGRERDGKQGQSNVPVPNLADSSPHDVCPPMTRGKTRKKRRLLPMRYRIVKLSLGDFREMRYSRHCTTRFAKHVGDASLETPTQSGSGHSGNSSGNGSSGLVESARKQAQVFAFGRTAAAARSLTRSLALSRSLSSTSDAPFLRRASSRRFRSNDSGRTIQGARERVYLMYVRVGVCVCVGGWMGICVAVFSRFSVYLCAVRPRRSHARFPGDDTPSRSHDVVGHDARCTMNEAATYGTGTTDEHRALTTCGIELARGLCRPPTG